MRFSKSEAPDTRGSRFRRLLAVIGATALITAGGVAVSVPASAEDGGVIVRSSDMTDGAALNPMFACTSPGFPFPAGGQVSPELAIDFGGTTPAAFAVVMHDEFGVNSAYDDGIDWMHWISYNMTPSAGVTEVPRNASQTNTLLGGVEGQNTWGEIGYRGPCPPSGPHNYYFTVYALSAPIAPANQTPAAIMAAIQGNAIDRGDLQVTFAPAQINTNQALVEFETATESLTESAGTVTTARLLVNGVVTAPSTATLLIDTSSCGHLPATDGTDYTSASGATITVPIPAGTYDGRAGTAIAIPGLSLINDTTGEPTECLGLQLVSVNGPGVSIGDAGHTDPIGPGSAHPGVPQTTWTLEIADDDLMAFGVTIEFSAATASGVEATGGTLPSLLVDGLVLAPITVTLTPTGTATSGTDYTAPLTVTIPAGNYDGTAATAVAVTGFTVTDDATDEPDETAIFTLSANPAEAFIGDANGDATMQSATTFTILDDDAPAAVAATVEFAAATGSAAEGAGGTLPRLLVNGTLAAPVQVTVNVTGGTANGSDFTAPTVVTIPAGTYDGTAATAVAIPGFTVTNDTVAEPDETILFSLTSGDQALLVVGDANANGTTVAALTFTITNDDGTPPATGGATGTATGGTTTGSLAATGGAALGGSIFVGLGLLLAGTLAVMRRTRKA